MFTSNVFDKILSEARTSNRSASDFECKSYDDEVDISTIGPLLWSKDHFISNIRLPSPDSGEESDDGGNDGPTRSSRDKGCGETKVHDEMQPTISSAEDFDCGQKRKRKSAAVRMTANEVCQELSKANVSPHLLIAPHIYGESFGAGAGASQPFQITVHPQVGFLSDLHGHLCDAEVIGLLAGSGIVILQVKIKSCQLLLIIAVSNGAIPLPLNKHCNFMALGKWDAESKMLYVQAAFPCASTERREDDGSTDVELDPVAELAVREIINNLGLIVVGWYHSHPQFRPDPSVTDIHNQQQYQMLMKDDVSGLEPFIGLIVSTFDVKLPSNESLHQWFHTRPYSDGSSRAKKVTAIPMLLDVQIGLFTDEYRDADAFLSKERTQQLTHILQGLSNDSPEAEGVTQELIVSGRAAESNGIDVYNESIDEDDNDYDSDNSAEDCGPSHGIYTDSAPTYPVQKKNSIRTDHSEKIPYNFTASGGFEYLGECAGDESEVLAATPEVKRKYMKKVVIPTVDEGGRKSGRETRAPTLFVPEKEEKEKKEKKEVIQPIDDGAVFTQSLDSSSSSQVKSVKSNKNTAKMNGVKVKTKSKLKGTSQTIAGDVFPKAPKGLVGKYAGSLDKWLAAGAVEVPSSIPSAKKTKKSKTNAMTNASAKSSVKGKGSSRVVDVMQPLPLPSEVEVKEEVKRRHGPGARGKTKPSFLSFRDKESNQSDAPTESGIESSSSSSSVLGKRKKEPDIGVLSEKRKITLKVKWPPESDDVKEKKSSGSVIGKKGKSKVKIEKLKVVVAKKSISSGDTDGVIQKKKKVHAVEELDKEEEEVISLLQRLQGQSPASVQGRMLLCSVKPLYRCLIQGIVSLGFYYTTHPRRTTFTSMWRDNTLKIDKLRESILHWAGKLFLSISCQNTLVSDIVTFLLSCWAEGEESVRKLQNVPKKKKKSTATHDELCAHTSKDGRSIIYKEDNGKDDVPKKKKKKKLLKI